MSRLRQMWNQSGLWIQSNRTKTAQVLRGGNVWWKRRRASEGHRQRDHYANSAPLCLTSNNTALYICKAWQDTVHTALLSERSHARAVTPNGWPLSAMRLLGQSSHFIRTDAHKHWQKLLITCSTQHISGVKHGRGAETALCSTETWCQKLNNLISGAPLRWKVLD